MMKSNLIKTMVTSLVVVLLIGTVAFVLVLNTKDDSAKGKSATIDDIAEFSYETSEMTTDLEDGSFVRIQFQIVTDGKKTKKELEKREFQLKNILIKKLATMDKEDFKSGLSGLEDKIKSELNEVMTEGDVTEVYTINKILQ